MEEMGIAILAKKCEGCSMLYLFFQYSFQFSLISYSSFSSYPDSLRINRIFPCNHVPLSIFTSMLSELDNVWCMRCLFSISTCF